MQTDSFQFLRIIPCDVDFSAPKTVKKEHSCCDEIRNLRETVEEGSRKLYFPWRRSEYVLQSPAQDDMSER